MLTLLFCILLIIHGLIHVIGFLKGANRPSKERIIWLVTGVLWIGGGVLVIVKASGWAIVILVSVIISQSLILRRWHDAKYGTCLNVIIFFPLVIHFSNRFYSKNINAEIDQLVAQASMSAPYVLSNQSIKNLPISVQKWLRHSGAVGKTIPRVVRLTQKGWMRTSPGGEWMETNAKQYFNTVAPSFIWNANVRWKQGVYLTGVDRLRNGQGQMTVRIFSLYPMINEQNNKINQGSILRFLAEMVWFPSVAVSPYIHWRSINDSTAEGTITDQGVQASGIFYFDKQGKFLCFKARRYMGGGRNSSLETWYIPAHKWRIINGIMIPTEGDVIWKLPGGDFNYFRWEIQSIFYQ